MKFFSRSIRMKLRMKLRKELEVDRVCTYIQDVFGHT